MYLCDGASEHGRFFNLILTKTSDFDPDLKLEDGEGIAISDPPHILKKSRNNLLSSGEREWHTKRLQRNGNHTSWKVIETAYALCSETLDGHSRSLRAIPKFIKDVVSPSGVQLLRVGLAARAFSKDVRDFITTNLSEVVKSSGLRESDVRETLTFLTTVDELFKIMNSEEAITWSSEVDDAGVPIGHRDKLDLSHGFKLNKFADMYGVSLEYLQEISGLTSGESVPDPAGPQLIIDRPARILNVYNYFREWHDTVHSMNVTAKIKDKMFITHWLYTDIRRTCLGTLLFIKQNVHPDSTNELILQKLNQDNIEKIFGQLRNLSGSNRNMTREDVDAGFGKLRSDFLESVIDK